MTTLLCMGFSDAAAIRKALRLAKNDINEAVALLTNERPGLHYGGYEPMESGQGPPGGHGSPAGGQGPRGGDGDGGGGGGGFDPPPAYHEVVETEVSCGLPLAGCPGTGLLSAPASPRREWKLPGSLPAAAVPAGGRRPGGWVLREGAPGEPPSPSGWASVPGLLCRPPSRLAGVLPLGAGECGPGLFVAIAAR